MQQIDGTLSTIEMQRDALESASSNTAIIDTMHKAAGAMKNAHKQLDVGTVNDIMDDIAEQQEVAKEISDAISNPVSFGQVVKSLICQWHNYVTLQEWDDEEIEAELDALGDELDEEEQRELTEKMLDVGPARLPEVPRTDVPRPQPVKKKEEDDPDMAELAAWALWEHYQNRDNYSIIVIEREKVIERR